MTKPAYSVSFLLSVIFFVWQNVLYFPKTLVVYRRHSSNYIIHTEIHENFGPKTLSYIYIQNIKVKVAPSYTNADSRDVEVLILNVGARRWVSNTPRPFYVQERNVVPYFQGAV